jgi:NADH dehydrogenase [ubiquinone] 1 alpha subcomplex assembly factor 7
MQIALGDSEYGYYMRRDPFGTKGDFITAPEVSQMFGELIGLALAQSWRDLGAPVPFHLVELGPGRGTLMKDALRATQKVLPAFRAAARVTLVETSPALRDIQRQAFADAEFLWADMFVSVPDDAPLFLIANEFFDALPIRQFVKSRARWHERMVVERDGALDFALSPEPAPDAIFPQSVRGAEDGAVFEINPAAESHIQAIASRIVKNDGTAIIADYGHVRAALGDTLQAVQAHAYAKPLAAPGEADITAHVDFERLAAAGRQAGAVISGPVTQAAFLKTLGIDARAKTLKAASPAEKSAIDSQVERLTAFDEMGTLFKVLGLSSRNTALAGFT